MGNVARTVKSAPAVAAIGQAQNREELRLQIASTISHL